MDYTVLWLIWIALFGAIEIPALINRQGGDTLSEHVRKWFSTREKSKGWLARRTALGAFLAWLAYHFF